MTLPEIPQTQPGSHEDTSTQAPCYQLRTNRAPRYRCGTSGSRNCSCVKLIATEPPDLRLARGAMIPACELALAQAPEHPQHNILTVRAQEHKSPPTIRHIIMTVAKTYGSP